MKRQNVSAIARYEPPCLCRLCSSVLCPCACDCDCACVYVASVKQAFINNYIRCLLTVYSTQHQAFKMEEGVRLVVEGLPSPFQVPKVKEFFNGRLFLFLSLFTVPNNSYKCQNDMTTFVILVLGQSRQKL